jgi:hypothetical protein
MPGQIDELHTAAMVAAEKGFIAKITGDDEASLLMFREAYLNERMAAELLRDKLEEEPTRSVLYRSAASLALEVREFREAERLVSLALAGDPPEEICDELRDVLEQVYFGRHLDLRGLQLDAGEFQMSLVGAFTGFGIAPSDEFIVRAATTETALIRTAERLQSMPFRETGAVSNTVRDKFPIYFSVPRAASFAVSLRIGRPHQPQMVLPGFSEAWDVVEEFLECLKCFENGNEDELRNKISDEAYFNNFTGLAKRLEPDGRRIKTVGFTSVRNRNENRVALTGANARKWQPLRTKANKIQRIIGNIKAADETDKVSMPVFSVIDGTNHRHNIYVPPGMLEDIVRPLWGRTVAVVAELRNHRLCLIDVHPQDEQADNLES